jgi:hypothetical protein
MQADLPKTINDAVKILAYNDYFWASGPKSPNGKIKPHPKDYETVHSLAEAQYPWTEKQAKLALVILKRYLTKFEAHGMDIKELLTNPTYDSPFRIINTTKSIEKFIDDDMEKIEVRFPYDKKIVQLIKMLKDQRGLPTGYVTYDGESKTWTFKQTDVTTYFLTLIAIRYDFKFIDETLLDDFDEVKKEIMHYKQPVATLKDSKILISHASESLHDYWNENIKDLPLIQQVDSCKNLGLSTRGMKIRSWSGLGGKIACTQSDRMWISSKDYSKNELMNALLELNCFPLVIPVSGDPYTTAEASEWQEWLDVFYRHGIENKNLAFGFDMKEPKKINDQNNLLKEKWTEKMEEHKFQTLCELWQMAKQFKYIDSNTKIIFVRNRIPKTLIKSQIKVKASLVSLGGGYYASGTNNLKRYLDSLPKTLYYNDYRPSNYDWSDRVIMKL